ncbi:hypothetical protein ANO11243_051850 [Dothideomycetidae sp. 11243]|nr:hypothetical protein ANO11243_051850 [fungal sp. No.11243]
MSAAALSLRSTLTPEQHSVNSKKTLSPLPDDLHRGLTAVAVLGLLSFVSAVGLFLHLCYRLVTHRRSKLHRNQFFLLLFNLLIADIEQSVAFWLNIQWLRLDGVHVGTVSCWTQGFFVSVGDLSSGVFTLFIAVHTFVDIVFDRRMPYKAFLAVVAACHAFVFMCAFIAIGMHPHDIYVRAGAWCWINSSYQSERLWLHYFWILIAEFGTVLMYGALFFILQRRLRSNYYADPGSAERAKAAARSIIPYPIVYVVCTLPLASARISSMVHNTPTYAVLTFAGAMITSNGWLDVLLYSFTRRTLIFGNQPIQSEMRALDTFVWNHEQYGTTTHIEANAAPRGSSSRKRAPPSRLNFSDHRNSSQDEERDKCQQRAGRAQFRAPSDGWPDERKRPEEQHEQD